MAQIRVLIERIDLEDPDKRDVPGLGGDPAVAEEEVARALNQEASRYPGQERQIIEFYQKTPGALAQIRAPIYEEKVVDYILERATVTDKSVSRKELEEDDE